MEHLKRSWRKTPSTIRKPIVLTVGLLFVISSVLFGWVPGPGGIPLFLIGIAILSSEYAWARRFRDFSLKLVKDSGRWYRDNRATGNVLAATAGLSAVILGLVLFQLF